MSTPLPAKLNSHYISISKAAKILKVSADTLRNWEKQGKLVPQRTVGGARRYNLTELESIKKELGPRVSPRLLSISKAASLLQVSADTLRNWEKRSLIQADRTAGGARRYALTDVNDLKRQLNITSVPELVVQPEPLAPKVVQPASEPVKRVLTFHSLRFITTACFLIFLLTLEGISGLYLANLSKDQNASQVLGAKAEDLGAQIYQLSGVLETVQKQLLSLEQKLPQNSQSSISNQALSQQSPVIPALNYFQVDQQGNLILGNSRAETFSLKASLVSDIIPAPSNTFNLGSTDHSFRQIYVNNLSSQNFSLDSNGSLVVKSAKIDNLVLTSGIDLTALKVNLENNSLDPSKFIQTGRSASDTSQDLASAINALVAVTQSQTSKIATINSSINTINTHLTVQDAQIASISAQLASSNPTPVPNLTPPDLLFATGSAELANLKVNNQLNLSSSATLTNLGETLLGHTIIAGDLTQAGNFSVVGNLSINGGSINSIDTLKLQDGLVTIDKNGNLVAQSILVAEFKVVANKISGSGKISAASSSADVVNPLVTQNSRILITPTSPTNQVLAVTSKVDGQKFTVSANEKPNTDISFDW